MLTWNRRRSFVEGETATFARRYDRSHKYCVCEVESKYGLAPRVLAIVADESGERIVSRHRGARAAQRSLEKIAKRGAA